MHDGLVPVVYVDGHAETRRPYSTGYVAVSPVLGGAIPTDYELP